MMQSLLTIVAPLARERLADAEAAIERLEAAAPRPGAEASGGAGLHFASLHAIRSPSSARAYLLLEVSADGAPAAALAQVAAGLGAALRDVFVLAADWRDEDLAAYLLAHRLGSGGGWFSPPGIGFAGTPGLTVGRIRADAALAARCAALIEAPGGATATGALARLRAVRAALGAAARDLPTDDAPVPWTAPTTPRIAARLAGSFATTYLWPLLLLDLLTAGVAGALAARSAAGAGAAAARFLLAAAAAAVAAGLLLAVAAALALGLAYLRLRAAEKTDPVDERAPDRAANAALFARENRCRQNHMISITVRKPGPLRSFTLRLAFWAIGRLAGFLFPPGFLGTIGTIHFARWVSVPGTRDLVFLSNFGGSWESYLEDFITRAHKGLTGVWSNSVGFPRAHNLVGGGATDSERFKRYARASMVPTLFWYSAYPELTTAAIRANAAIRRGLAGIETEDAAAGWLALFGSAARPAAKLVSSEIQSLAFGGMKFLPFGRCLAFARLPDDAGAARRWLAAVRPHVAWNDGRRLRHDAVVTLALGPGGLARLGLPADGVAAFPFAFLDGMAGRRRILGDAPDAWAWGADGVDAALLVYGRTAADVDRLCAALGEAAAAAGMAPAAAIELAPVTDDKTEPFGFVDGISQPVIRGTYKGMRNADPIHLVEPGEFLLGYPDGRGNLPPAIALAPAYDPGRRLPLAAGADDADPPRDLGFNGSFLVIRELEQRVDAFWTYCAAEAARLRDDPRLPEPYVVTAEFIAAKLIGRWPDGSSLARYPYEPRSAEARRRAVRPTQRPTTHPEGEHPAVERFDPAPGTGEGGGESGDNDFLLGTEDPEALRCPFGAHVRRANPRDSLAPGAADELAITNRHRLLRVGRRLAARPGLLFLCLNGDIERQFEFVQQTWLRNPAFHGLAGEGDAVLGDGEPGSGGFTIPTRAGPIRLAPTPAFVAMRGGGYFFVPGKRLLDFLAGS